jgi:hypothetical protein
LVWIFINAGEAEASACTSLKKHKTRINVKYTIAPPHYNLSQSISQLNQNSEQHHNDWLKKHGLQKLWSANDLQTAGLAEGGWGFSWKFGLDGEKVDQFGSYWCLYFTDIELEVFYRTIIYIPTEYPKGTCSFKVVHEHELAHHNINKDAVEKYLKKLEADLSVIIEHLEGMGHVGYYEVESRAETMKAGIQDAVEIYIQDSMIKEMNRNNSNLDSPQEYARTSQLMNQCRKK